MKVLAILALLVVGAIAQCPDSEFLSTDTQPILGVAASGFKAQDQLTVVVDVVDVVVVGTAVVVVGAAVVVAVVGSV